MNIVNNFLPLSYQKELLELLTGDSFNWRYKPSTYDSGEGIKPDNKTIDAPQFVHLLFNETGYISEMFTLFRPMLYFYNQPFKNIVRMKVNLLYGSDYPKDCYHMPHVDALEDNNEYKSILYYVNDSDGATYFFNDNSTVIDKVEPQRGKAVIFNSRQYHASSSPSKHKTRIVINTVIRL